MLMCPLPRRYKRLFMPEPYHIVQEIQKYNLPDYRPRMEQFQKVRVADSRHLALLADTCLPAFDRQSRRFGLSSACGETAALPSHSESTFAPEEYIAAGLTIALRRRRTEERQEHLIRAYDTSVRPGGKTVES